MIKQQPSFLELHRVQQAEAAIAQQQSYTTNNSSSANQRQDRGNANERTPVIFDNELRRLLTSGDLLVQNSSTNLVNQRTSEQIADELKTLREKVKSELKKILFTLRVFLG